MTARLLVFGRAGQVARALAAARTRFEVVCAGRETLDLLRSAPDVPGLMASISPVAVVNAAAYTAVDAAETERAAAERLNRHAPARIGAACRDLGIPLVHFSTDYVFDGEKGAPYVETDSRAPINAYGSSKAEGEAALEQLAREEGLRVAIARVSWVFARGGGGFLDAMIRAGAERDAVSVVDDQWGCPTPADACAAAALGLIEALLGGDGEAEGLFHAAGARGLTRADFAHEIFKRLSRRPRLERVASSAFPAAARRPRDTRLSSARLDGRFGWRAPELSAALDACLKTVAAAHS